MCCSWIAIKRSFEDSWKLAPEVFTSGKRDDIKSSIVLFVTCTVFSLFLVSLLLLYLIYSLDYDLTVAGGIAGSFGFLFTLALFLSKRVRCFGTLFFISIFMKKSRTLLLTAGTSLVVLRNIRNTLENLTGLARSVICNLRAKNEAITSSFSNYVKMLKWLGNILKRLPDLGVISFDSTFKISPKVDMEILQERLIQAEQKLNETVKYTRVIMNTVSSVSSRMFPVISFLLLLTLIMLHVRKFCKDIKYKNKFITDKFVSFDEKQKAEGKPYVLPLTPEEEKLYTRVRFVRPTTKEGKAMLKFCIPVVSCLVAWTIFITVDALLYLFVDIVTTKLSEMEPFHVPLIISIKMISSLVGISFNEDNHAQDLSYSITLFEKKCLPKPKLLLFNSIAPLIAILLMLLIMAVMAGKLSQVRLVVCERFFSTTAEQRVEHLHAKIRRKRTKRRKEKDSESSKLFLQVGL